MADAKDGGPWVRIVVVNYNGGDYLQPCLDALAGQTLRDFEVVVVDNASTDGSAEGLRFPDARFRLIRNAANVGFAAANNIGAAGATSPWLATLNPDTIARPAWLAGMRAGTKRHPGVEMFGATLVRADNPEVVDGFGDVLSIAGIPWRGGCGMPVAELPDSDIEVFAPCAAAAFYRQESFERAGGFDERFFCYVEDVDLGFRLRLAGGTCVQLRDAIVLHHGSALTGRTSAFTLYHSYRNRLWVLFKNMPLALLVVSVPANLLASAFFILRQGWAGAPVRAAFKGLWRGLVSGPAVRRRSSVRGDRRISTLAVARALDWNPLHLRRCSVVALDTGAAPKSEGA
jgi:N-acetylglucosaminyl-diphospho-decaprenol L-rhamnosyltransferase